MDFTNTDLISINNSRRTLLEVFRETNTQNTLTNIQDYDKFNINEVEAMARNNQLDMLLTHRVGNLIEGHSIYVKYMLSKTTIRLQAIDVLVEELFEEEGILKKTDTLIVVVNDEPNDSMKAKLRYLYDNQGIFVIVQNIKRIQRNILKHKLVSKHTVVGTHKYNDGVGDNIISDIDRLKQKYNLKNLNQLPEISRFDPVSQLIELRPGQVCKIDRKSVTSVESEYFRICV